MRQDMALSATHIAVIRRTWAEVVPAATIAANLFYTRLFEIAPKTRALFKPDLKAQGKKLIDTLSFVVDHLDSDDELQSAAADLAIRHVRYGVTADQYAPVGAALVWTLESMLGDRFGPTEREAWSTAYGVLSAKMIAAAYPQQANEAGAQAPHGRQQNDGP